MMLGNGQLSSRKSNKQITAIWNLYHHPHSAICCVLVWVWIWLIRPANDWTEIFRIYTGCSSLWEREWKNNRISQNIRTKSLKISYDSVEYLRNLLYSCSHALKFVFVALGTNTNRVSSMSPACYLLLRSAIKCWLSDFSKIFRLGRRGCVMKSFEIFLLIYFIPLMVGAFNFGSSSAT